jgi:hypothetical protein
LTILALNFSRILINIYTMLSSHIKPITRRIFSRCHKFNNSRINSNQPCNQSKHFMIVINFLLKKKYHNICVRKIMQPVMGTFVKLKQINFKSQRIYIFIHIQLVP